MFQILFVVYVNGLFDKWIADNLFCAKLIVPRNYYIFSEFISRSTVQQVGGRPNAAKSENPLNGSSPDSVILPPHKPSNTQRNSKTFKTRNLWTELNSKSRTSPAQPKHPTICNSFLSDPLLCLHPNFSSPCLTFFGHILNMPVKHSLASHIATQMIKTRCKSLPSSS